MSESTDPAQKLAATVAPTVSRRWPIVSGVVAIVLVGSLAAIIATRPGAAFSFDVEWMDEIVEHRSPGWEVPALVMNALGGGILGSYIIPVAIIVALLLFRRPWAARYYAVAALVSVGLTQLIKELVGRARPEQMLVQSDYGSFPSGHTANAATTMMAFAFIFPLLWVWIAGFVYTVAMALSRTYLGAHWISDTVGGAILGVGVAVIVWAPFAGRLHDEAQRAHPPVWVRRNLG